MTINDKTVTYVDFRGQTLPDHDGKYLLVSEEHGYQFFGVDGKGFLHDGTPIKLADGRAIIHDGSPIELPIG